MEGKIKLGNSTIEEVWTFSEGDVWGSIKDPAWYLTTNSLHPIKIPVQYSVRDSVDDAIRDYSREFNGG